MSMHQMVSLNLSQRGLPIKPSAALASLPVALGHDVEGFHPG
jgi:hypothetical protein